MKEYKIIHTDDLKTLMESMNELSRLGWTLSNYHETMDGGNIRATVIMEKTI